jgi:hypothetical protein
MPEFGSDNLADHIIHQIKGDISSTASGTGTASKSSQRPSPAELQAIKDAVAKAADDRAFSEQQRNDFISEYENTEISIDELLKKIDVGLSSGEWDVATRRFYIRLLREPELGDSFRITHLLVLGVRDSDPQNRLIAMVGLAASGDDQFAINAYLMHDEDNYINTWKELARIVPFGDKIKELFSGIGEEYSYRAEMLFALNAAVRQEMASQLAPSLNAHIQGMPQANHEEKKAVARWVNEELRRFDLAIKGQNDQPSMLLAAPATSGDADVGRFMLEHKTAEGRRVRTQLPKDLPAFELMEANPRREALQEWRGKVGKQRGDVSLA